MIKTILTLSVLGLTCTGALAQSYCTPPPFFTGPYSGITNVQLGSLNNTTPDSDGVKYFASLDAPVLQIGSSYTLSVTTEHHLVGSGFSGNLFTHAWIDWNQDGDFEDDGERVMRIDDKFKGTHTSTVTVPANAKTGITRMRVYNDMPDYEGHEYPHPCGYAEYPSNPLGQHGESEDYDIEVSGSATGINAYNSNLTEYSVYRNASGLLQLNYELSANSVVSMHVFNALGQQVYAKNYGTQSAGKQLHVVNETLFDPNQIYIVQLDVNGVTVSKKLSFGN
jgi:hypothetical protein